jgi:O-antigen/teichoic acid export membrane protein
MIRIKKLLTNKYINNFSWLFAEKVLRLLIGFFVSIWMARYLGPESFGILTFAQSIIGILIAFVTLGLGPIITRDLLLNKYPNNSIFGTSFMMQILSALVIISIISLFVYYGNKNLESIIVLIISFSYIFQIMSMLDSYFQVKSLNKYVAISNTIAFTLSSIIKVFLIVYQFELIYFAYIAIFESFILASMYLYFYLKYESIKSWNYSFIVAKSLIKDSWPLMPHKISMVIIANIDMIMISKMMDNYSVGIYAMAYKIYLILIFLASIMTKVLFPALIKTNELKEAQDRRFIKFYRLMGMISISLILIYYFVGRDILLFAFGEEYSQSVLILNILIIAVFFSFINSVCDQWFVIQNYTKSFLFRTVIGAFINIILNIWFIEIFGLYGAAYATIITMLYITYFSNFMSKNSLKNLHLINQAFFGFLIKKSSSK